MNLQRPQFNWRKITQHNWRTHQQQIAIKENRRPHSHTFNTIHPAAAAHHSNDTSPNIVHVVDQNPSMDHQPMAKENRFMITRHLRRFRCRMRIHPRRTHHNLVVHPDRRSVKSEPFIRHRRQRAVHTIHHHRRRGNKVRTISPSRFRNKDPP